MGGGIDGWGSFFVILLTVPQTEYMVLSTGTGDGTVADGKLHHNDGQVRKVVGL